MTYLLDRVAIPDECIEDCSRAGSVDDAVAYWVACLNFKVSREQVFVGLVHTGAWSEDEIAEADNSTLARRVLWLACCDFAEDAECHTFILE